MGTCRNGRLPRSLHRRRRRAPCVPNVRKGGKRVNRVIVVGSPRVDGRSASLADQLMYACIEECPDDVVSIVSVASTRVEPCRGCDACAREAEALPTDMEEGDPLTPHPAIAASDAPLHRCVIADDMPEVRKHLDAADELIVVSPVYFAGPPAQFKALLDRLQPYWRSDVRTRVKRPMILHVVGEGGDPHGYDPLVGSVRSAFSVAGFELASIFDWVGKISEEGDLLDEPQEYVLMDEDAVSEAAAVESAAETEVVDVPGKNRTASASASDDGAKPKPKLSLSQPAKGAKRSVREGEGRASDGRQAAGRGRHPSGGDRRDSRDGQRSSKRGGRSSGGRKDGAAKRAGRGAKGGSSKGGRRG